MSSCNSLKILQCNMETRVSCNNSKLIVPPCLNIGLYAPCIYMSYFQTTFRSLPWARRVRYVGAQPPGNFFYKGTFLLVGGGEVDHVENNFFFFM